MVVTSSGPALVKVALLPLRTSRLASGEAALPTDCVKTTPPRALRYKDCGVVLLMPANWITPFWLVSVTTLPRENPVL